MFTCGSCHHKSHGDSCDVKIRCASCNHIHKGFRCECDVGKIPKDVVVPVMEDYYVIEDVVKYNIEYKEVMEDVQHYRPIYSSVTKTRQVPENKVREVFYTDYEQRSEVVGYNYGATQYNYYSVPIQRSRMEYYTENRPEQYEEQVTTQQPYYVNEKVIKKIQVPYTVKENVKKTRQNGTKTITKMVDKKCDCTGSSKCGCTRVRAITYINYVVRDICYLVRDIFKSVFSCCFESKYVRI